jgi:hypothetical protein
VFFTLVLGFVWPAVVEVDIPPVFHNHAKRISERGESREKM